MSILNAPAASAQPASLFRGALWRRTRASLAMSALLGLGAMGCATTQTLDHTVDEEAAAAIEGPAAKGIATGKASIEKSEAEWEKAKSDFSAQDSAIADAEAKIDAQETKVQAARDALEAAERNKEIAETGLSVEQARRDTLEARIKEREGAVMVAKARHELTKFKALAGAQGVAGPVYEEKLAQFQGQVAEKEGEHASAKEDYARASAHLIGEQEKLEDAKD